MNEEEQQRVSQTLNALKRVITGHLAKAGRQEEVAGFEGFVLVVLRLLERWSINYADALDVIQETYINRILPKLGTIVTAPNPFAFVFKRI